MAEFLGTEVEVDVTNVAHGGVAVARHEGRVIFVSDAIPGERVLVRITDDSKKSFWRAETLGVVSASRHRQPHVWASASIDRAPEDRAGGAEFGHIEISHQRELKRRVLADSLSRMAGIDSDVTVGAIAGNQDGTGWRTRVRLHVGPDGTPGPFAARTHHVVAVSDLPLAVAELVSITPFDEKFSGVDHVDVVVPSVGNPFVLTGTAPTPSRERGAREKARRPKPQRIVERVGDREFRLDARGFWQVHRSAAETLSSAVPEAIDASLWDPRAANLDLYGGVGLLAAAVGDRFGNSLRITTVESDPLATDHAAENLSEWVGAAAVTARVDGFLRRLRSTASASERARLGAGTVILDPPRAGAGKAVVDELLAIRPVQIVYVACDPVALSRDVTLFAAGGYDLTRLRAFDLFPNTHHVEAIATLTRASAAGAATG